MNKVKQGALALSLFAGAALVSAPAFANSIHDNGHFGGSWSRMGPSHHHDRYSRNFYRGYDRGYYRRYSDRGPMPLTARRIMITDMARALSAAPHPGFSSVLIRGRAPAAR